MNNPQEAGCSTSSPSSNSFLWIGTDCFRTALNWFSQVRHLRRLFPLSNRSTYHLADFPLLWFGVLPLHHPLQSCFVSSYIFASNIDMYKPPAFLGSVAWTRSISPLVSLLPSLLLSLPYYLCRNLVFPVQPVFIPLLEVTRLVNLSLPQSCGFYNIVLLSDVRCFVHSSYRFVDWTVYFWTKQYRFGFLQPTNLFALKSMNVSRWSLVSGMMIEWKGSQTFPLPRCNVKFQKYNRLFLYPWCRLPGFVDYYDAVVGDLSTSICLVAVLQLPGSLFRFFIGVHHLWYFPALPLLFVDENNYVGYKLFFVPSSGLDL